MDKLKYTGTIAMASFESAGVKEGDKGDRIGPAPSNNQAFHQQKHPLHLSHEVHLCMIPGLG